MPCSSPQRSNWTTTSSQVLTSTTPEGLQCFRAIIVFWLIWNRLDGSTSSLQSMTSKFIYFPFSLEWPYHTSTVPTFGTHLDFTLYAKSCFPLKNFAKMLTRSFSYLTDCFSSPSLVSGSVLKQAHVTYEQQLECIG